MLQKIIQTRFQLFGQTRVVGFQYDFEIIILVIGVNFFQSCIHYALLPPVNQHIPIVAVTVATDANVILHNVSYVGGRLLLVRCNGGISRCTGGIVRCTGGTVRCTGASSRCTGTEASNSSSGSTRRPASRRPGRSSPGRPTHTRSSRRPGRSSPGRPTHTRSSKTSR